MTTLDTIRKPIETELRDFDDFVRRNFSDGQSGLLAEMVDYILSSRGKGLRPAIVMLSAGACSPTGNFGKRTMLAGMLVEMIHVASLIHDDVIDESDMRRGRASVNARWQSRNAVIVGDYILARNMRLGLQSGQFDLLNHIIGSMTNLCEGEIIQSDHAAKFDTSREAYYDIINKKTASLFGTCASAGAMSVGASHDEVERMHRYGTALGMAFQIADDILDYTADNNTGKPFHNDLREHKITLPLIAVLEEADEELRTAIMHHLPLCDKADESIAFISGIVEKYGGVARARESMEQYILQAMTSLGECKPSPYRDALANLCTYVVERDR
ncbi:MAG: polyprenyl synthetase family protein [Alistipes sp.]